MNDTNVIPSPLAGVGLAPMSIGVKVRGKAIKFSPPPLSSPVPSGPLKAGLRTGKREEIFLDAPHSGRGNSLRLIFKANYET